MQLAIEQQQARFHYKRGLEDALKAFDMMLSDNTPDVDCESPSVIALHSSITEAFEAIKERLTKESELYPKLRATVK